MHNPRTPAEWQEAVNLAEACLLLESARLYGLITGGPIVHADRCEQLLRLGRRRKIYPQKSAVDEIICDLSKIGT